MKTRLSCAIAVVFLVSGCTASGPTPDSDGSSQSIESGTITNIGYDAFTYDSPGVDSRIEEIITFTYNGMPCMTNREGLTCDWDYEKRG